jgi:hypothetical protein
MILGQYYCMTKRISAEMLVLALRVDWRRNDGIIIG